MVEQYKREGIDIVLDSRKCIYTNDKNEKFIKQNKEYIPIVKKKGKYVIINKKGGAPKSFGERFQDWKSAEREREKIPEKLKESIPPHSSNEEIDEKTKLKNDIDLLEIKFNNTNIPLRNKEIIEMRKSLREKSKKLKDLEKQEAWNKKSPNPEKEQFLKEITEKEELIKSLQENHTEYKKKMDREDIYLDNYLKEKNNDIDLDFMYEENHPFLVEHLLKRIIDLEKRIDMTHN